MKIAKVVLIDDDEDEYMLFSDALKRIDHTIHICHVSGPVQDEEAKRSRLPNLVFLDINMPLRDGFAWLKWFKQQQYDFPVVMYSTSMNMEKIALSYQMGACLYLTKPLDFTSLVGSLQAILSLDWSQPAEITKQYYAQGFCRPFVPAV